MNKKYLDSLNDPFLLRWEKANIVWFGKDKTLTKEAHFVHQKLLAAQYSSKHYRGCASDSNCLNPTKQVLFPVDYCFSMLLGASYPDWFRQP